MGKVLFPVVFCFVVLFSGCFASWHDFGTDDDERLLRWMLASPMVRRPVWDDCRWGDCYGRVPPRGGGDPHDVRMDQLVKDLGPEFVQALEQNEEDHAKDCAASCELYYCAPPPGEGDEAESSVAVDSYPFGAVPPEDFATEFGFPLDLIKVTKDALFPPAEAAHVIRMAEEEGLSSNEFPSGKYKLGGDWLDELPTTRAWFNDRLRDTFFPLLHRQFPTIVSHPSALRAHSVSLLKYNSTHPRTDIHIDNGVLALTVALSPIKNYSGGGTLFEHWKTDVLTMDVGQATVRPGSVRHGGQRVTSGTRYVLGCFLLVTDRVEHVRRLKNRGSALRREHAYAAAIQQFAWALRINPKCTTCLKDWAEILQRQGHYEMAEAKVRQALELLEYRDSDALFNLGVILSHQGRDAEAVAAYRQSVALNADDTELLFNLGTKLGAQGNTREEMEYYAKAVALDASFGKAWLNWGTALAEAGDLDEAEIKFTKALKCDTSSMVKAMMNLSLVYLQRGKMLAQQGSFDAARTAALQSSNLLDEVKPHLDDWDPMPQHMTDVDDDSQRYIGQYRPQRLQAHRLCGQIFAAMQDMEAAEQEFRTATESFPDDPMSWFALQRVLELSGNSKEATRVKEIVQRLQQQDSNNNNNINQ